MWQDKAQLHVQNIESSVIELVVLRVERNIRVDEKTNGCYFVKKSCKDRIFYFAKQIKIRNQKA